MKIAFDGVTVIEEVHEAKGMRQRMRGLLGREGLQERTAMLLSPCSSIHTWFMRFSLDLIFLDKQNRVVRVCRNVKPWGMVWGGASAFKVLELEAGLTNLKFVHEGAQAEFVD